MSMCSQQLTDEDRMEIDQVWSLHRSRAGDSTDGLRWFVVCSQKFSLQSFIDAAMDGNADNVEVRMIHFVFFQYILELLQWILKFLYDVVMLHCWEN